MHTAEDGSRGDEPAGRGPVDPGRAKDPFLSEILRRILRQHPDFARRIEELEREIEKLEKGNPSRRSDPEG
jgi:hypothetical protein